MFLEPWGLAGALHSRARMLALTAAVMLAAASDAPEQVTVINIPMRPLPRAVTAPVVVTKPSVEDLEWPVWPAVSCIPGLIAVLVGTAAAFSNHSTSLTLGSSTTQWLAIDGLTFGGVLILGSIIWGSIAQAHNSMLREEAP